MSSSALIRPIEENDIEAVVDLMDAFFVRRTADYFREGLEKIGARSVPDGGQRWGQLIDDGGVVCGVILAISSERDYGAVQQTYTNLSTWCVRPTHRGPLAREMYDRACGPDHWVTTNLSAVKHVLKTIDKLRFRVRTTGQFVAFASRNRARGTRMLSLQEGIGQGLADCHVTTMQNHAARGCAVGCLATPDRLMPLIFLPRTVSRVIPCWQLIYCEDMTDFLAYCRPVLPWLRRKGRPALIIDTSADMPELYGKFIDGKAAKFLRGADPIWDVDHTYSEAFYLGF